MDGRRCPPPPPLPPLLFFHVPSTVFPSTSKTRRSEHGHSINPFHLASLPAREEEGTKALETEARVLMK